MSTGTGPTPTDPDAPSWNQSDWSGEIDHFQATVTDQSSIVLAYLANPQAGGAGTVGGGGPVIFTGAEAAVRAIIDAANGLIDRLRSRPLPRPLPGPDDVA